MKSITRRLLLSAIGGALLVLGILSAYNGLTINTPLYSIPAIIFIGVSIISFWQAFQ